MWQWELQVLGQELLDVRSLDISGLLDFSNLQDVDRSKSSSVSGGHVLVQSFNGTNSGDISNFFVHVVGTRSGVVSNPDGEVLDLSWVSFVDGVDRDNLTGSLLDLVQFLQEVPVTRLGNNFVRSEDSHSEQLWFRNGFSWQTTANNLVFIQTSHCGDVSITVPVLYFAFGQQNRGYCVDVWGAIQPQSSESLCRFTAVPEYYPMESRWVIRTQTLSQRGMLYHFDSKSTLQW